MRLVSVQLQNLKSYAEPTTIELEPGVNALVGHNGAGKSTVLEAIGAALFDYLPYRQEEFVRRGERSGRIVVTVQSREDERQYQLVRVVGKNPAWYVYDPELDQRIEEGQRPVTAWLIEHLGLPPGTDLKSLFLDSVGPPQGTFTAPFLDTPTDRKGKFDRLLRVSDYVDAWSRLKDVRQELETRRASLHAEVRELSAHTQRLPAVAQAHERARADALRLEALVGELTRELEAADLQDARLRLASERLAEARAQHAAREGELAMARERLASVAADLALSEQAAAIVAASRAGYEAHQAAQARLREQEARRQRRDALREDQQSLRERMQRDEAALSGLARELELAQADADRLEALAPQLALQAAAEEAFRAQQRLVSELEAAAQEAGRLTQELEAAAQERDEAERELRECRIAAQEAGRLDPVREELDGLREALGGLRARHQQLREAIEARARVAEEVARLAAEEDQLRAELARLDGVRPAAAALGQREAAERELAGRQRAAELALDELRRTRAQVEGGLCPFLAEPCMNVAEKGDGLTLESFFDQQIATAERALAPIAETLSQARAMLEEARGAAAELAAEPGLRRQLVQLAAQRARAEQERDQLLARERELADAPEQVAAAEARLAALQALLPALTQAAERAGGLQAAQRRLIQATHRERDVRARLERREQELARLPEAAEALAEAERQVAEAGNARGAAEALRSRAARVPQLRAQVAERERGLGEARATLAELAAQLAPFADVDALVGAAQAERDRTQEDAERFVRHRQLAELLDERRAAHRAAEDAAQRRATALQEALAALETAERAYDPQEHAALTTRRAELRGELGAAESERDRARLDAEETAAEITRLEALDEQRRQREADVAELEDLGRLLERLRSHVREAGPRIAQTLLERVSIVASAIFGEVMGDASGRLEWRADYEVLLHQRGQQRVFKQLSGGEQMVAALAIRLALLRLFSELDVAFLDEPTTNMDDTRRANLARQLQALRGFDQMVVISHDDAFDGLYGHVHHISKVDGASLVEPAE